MTIKTNNIVKFPTEIVRAEAKIDRAYNEYLELVAEEKLLLKEKGHSNFYDSDITVVHRLSFTSAMPQCSYVNEHIISKVMGRINTAFFPSVFNEN